MKIKTWQVEMLVVAVALLVVSAINHFQWIELVGSAAVLLSFGHAQVSDRMAEREALKLRPDVGCHRMSARYFVGKEVLWLIYFVAHQSWSALVGVGLFLLYPQWRRLWRHYHPLSYAWVPAYGSIKTYIKE